MFLRGLLHFCLIGVEVPGLFALINVNMTFKNANKFVFLNLNVDVVQIVPVAVKRFVLL
jgi:hypothetical protein